MAPPTARVALPPPVGLENYFRKVAAAWGGLEQFVRINDKYSG
jgi:hypothetical protein